MRHEHAGIAGLLSDAGTAFTDRGLPLVQSIVAGGELHAAPDAIIPVDDPAFRTRLAHAEACAISAVRRHADDSLAGEAQWREIRCAIRTDGARTLQVRIVAHGVARRSLESDMLAGAAASLACMAGQLPGATIADVRVYATDIEGRGRRRHPAALPADVEASLPAEKPSLAGARCAVVTLSDRASQGVYEDKSGARLAEMLSACGATLVQRSILPDDAGRLADEVRALAARGDIDLVACTGGTGIGPRDITPETLLAMGIRPVPGIGELLRAHSSHIVRSAWISRAIAGTLGTTFVIALPGSHKAVTECMEALLPLLPHTLSMLRGGSHG